MGIAMRVQRCGYSDEGTTMRVQRCGYTEK